MKASEIRNLVYEHSMSDSRQALVVHRPRMASLRSHTRLDRYRPMESDVKDQELGRELDTRRDTRANTDTISRESFRPFITLTHVCRQIRDEYRPIFLEKQEIGMDVTEAVAYLQTFYSGAPQEFKKLGFRPNRKGDLPYTGNLTIALGGTLKDIEKLPEGVQVLPLLDIWANSFKMEAGFGRYQQHGYVPERDGEAKDL